MNKHHSRTPHHSAVKADPVRINQLAEHLLDVADQRWPGNLWNHLESGSVRPAWLNRLLRAAVPFPCKREVLQEALQISWSENRDFHEREYFDALFKISGMVRSITT